MSRHEKARQKTMIVMDGNFVDVHKGLTKGFLKKIRHYHLGGAFVFLRASLRVLTAKAFYPKQGMREEKLAKAPT